MFELGGLTNLVNKYIHAYGLLKFSLPLKDILTSVPLSSNLMRSGRKTSDKYFCATQL